VTVRSTVPARGSSPADVLLTGGRVMTMDAQRRSAEAVAVTDGRIVAVGRSVDLRPLVGPRTRVIELRGRTLLPGFQDAHVHPVLGVGLLRCPLFDIPENREAYVEAIAAYANAHQDLDWVQGDGWSMAVFPGGTPRREDLDRAVPDRPAFFANRDGHGAWVNSHALALAGVDRGTPDPVDGRIERDLDGTPSGTLHESAVDLVERLIPPPTQEDVIRGLTMVQSELHALGITAWQDAEVTPADLAAYRVFVERGLLTGRAIACQVWVADGGADQVDEMIEGRRMSAMGRLRATTVKIFQDGVMENFSAAMLQPYLGSDGRPTKNRGHSLVEPSVLNGVVTALDAAGFQVHFHTLGDRAVREALDAIAAARTANGPTDGRHHLAHLQQVDPADMPRFGELGAGATIQPLWACLSDQVTLLTIPFIGPERGARQYPFGSLQRAGARLAGGSDWSVSTANVFEQAQVAVTRRDPGSPDEPPLGPEEALDLVEVLAAFTSGSAYVNHLDDVTGTVEIGKLADLVVLDRDIEAEPVTRIGEARVLLTLIEGEPVHDTGAL
jgi:predicted amidohydrolase YtcJ